MHKLDVMALIERRINMVAWEIWFENSE